MFKCSVALLVLFFVGSCSCAKLPPNYKRCDRKAADVDQCLIQAFQGILVDFLKPVPEIGLPLMEPLLVPELILGAGNGAVAVDQKYTNLYFHGFKDAEVTKLKFDFDKKIMEWEVLLPTFRINAHYEMSGKILVLPVQGSGPDTIIFDRCTFNMKSPFEITEKKGIKNSKKHLKFSNSKLVMSPEHVSYNYENLFNGNKELGDNINKVLNENWKQVYGEVEDGFEKACAAVLEGVANSLFGKVALSDIFLNES